MALFNSMSMRGKITLAACALGFLAAAVFIVKMAGAPSYTTVMTGVDPAKTSQITTALTAAGVPFELQNGGTAVGVQKGKETAANVALASKGLNSGTTQPGFEILDKQKLGASSQQQQIAYQRGLEGTIANTIGQIDGAGGAQVHLTLGQDNLFADESQPATAAVLLPQDASGMDPASVKGIANLVAASVPKPQGLLGDDHRRLRRDAVALGRRRGRWRWRRRPAEQDRGRGQVQRLVGGQPAVAAGPHARPGQGAGRRPLRPQRRQDRRAGPDLHGQDRRRSPRRRRTESLKGSGSTSGGTSGTASNLPSYAANATGGSGNNNYKNTTTDKTNGADKTITKTQKATGAVNRLDVAVLLDKSVKLQRAQMTALKASLASAAGLQIAQRKDTLNITEGLAFAKVPTTAAKAGPIPAAFAGILKGVGIGLGALLFLFFVTRHLRKRERGELIDEPSWLRTLEAAQPKELMPMPDLSGAGAGRDRGVDRQRRPAAPAARHDHPG